MPHALIILSETLQHVLNIETLWRTLPLAPPPLPAARLAPYERPARAQRTTAAPPLASLAPPMPILATDLLAAQLAVQQAAQNHQQALQQQAAMLLNTLSAGGGVLPQATPGNEQSLLLSLFAAQQQSQLMQAVAAAQQPASSASTEAETLHALAQLKHIPGAQKAVLQFIKTLAQPAPAVSFPPSLSVDGAAADSSAALAAVLAAQQQQPLMQQLLSSPAHDALVTLPSLQVAPALPNVSAPNLGGAEDSGVLLQQFMSMVQTSPVQAPSQGSMDSLLRMLQGGSSS